MNMIHEVSDRELLSNIEKAKDLNDSIMQKLIVVFGKFENLLVSSGKAYPIRSEHEALNQGYNDLMKKLNDPLRGL